MIELSHRITWPAAGTPEWAPHVERWYQLDAPAFAMADAYWKHRETLGQPPGWLLLASPGGSNFTDHQFMATETPSPAKFVHTLPNIRGVSLLQLMKWQGQVLCLQRDPDTISFALEEAARISKSEETLVWVAYARQEGPDWIAGFYRIGQTC